MIESTWYDEEILGAKIGVQHMGTKGLINYNPISLQRQFGFVMTNGPTEREVKETVYFGKGGDVAMFERVKVA